MLINMLDVNLKHQVLKSKVWDGKIHLDQEKEKILLLVGLREHGQQPQQNGVIIILKTFLVMIGN